MLPLGQYIKRLMPVCFCFPFTYVQSATNLTLPSEIAPFFEDTQLDFSLRNTFKHLSTSDYGRLSVQNAWGQGITLDYRSGYLADIFGVDASYYGVIKLGAGKDFWGRSILYNDNGHAKGFNKMGQIYGKLRLENEDVYLRSRFGWQQLKSWGMITNSSRAIPSTYLGWSGETGFWGMRMRGAYVTNYSDRDSPDKVRFLTADRKREVSHLVTGDIQLQQGDYSALYFWGESHNYMRRQGLELAWRPESYRAHNFAVSTQLYYNQALDDWKRMKVESRAFDNNAWHYALHVDWRGERWKHKAGFSYTHAPLDGGLGFFERHPSKHSRGTFNSMADSWGNDYIGHREKMLAWTFGYFITPEVEVGAVTNYGWGMHFRTARIERGEAIFFSRWMPSEIDNLALSFSAGPSWNYQRNQHRPILKSDGSMLRATNNSVEFQIDYKFKLR